MRRALLLRMNRAFRLLLAGALAAGSFACGDGGEPPLTDDDVLFGLESNPDALRCDPSVEEACDGDLPSEGKFDEVLPATFDLVATQSPIKSQGRRGVCSIFGTTAYQEHLYIVEGTLTMPDFSEQFLQWSTKFEVGAFRNTSGSNASTNLRALARYGSVLESDWPYEASGWTATNDPECDGEESDQPTRCHTNGEPPEAALMAQRWFLGSSGRWISTRPESIKSHMFNTGTAVQAGGDFYYQAWGHGGSEIPTYGDYRQFGYVVTPNAEDVRSSNTHRAGHSFLLVGWSDELEVQAIDAEGNLAEDENGDPIMQRGFFLFKNSWGDGWATENPFGAGYGWISYEYVQRYLSAYIADKPELAIDEICGNGEDDDFNGAIDCADAACSMDRACVDPAGSYTSEAPVAIPDNDAMGATSTITVADSGTLSGVSVDVDITHTYRGDLTVTLTKDDRTVTLFEREGAGADDLVATYDVSDFDGEDAAGDWILTVIDNANADEGTLNSWTLHLTTCAGGDCGSMPSTINGMNDTLGVIPDNDMAGVDSDIVITESGTISTVRVTIDVTHSFIGDLVVSISKDGGSAIELMREDLVEGDRLMRTFTVEGLSGDAAGTYTLNVADLAEVDQGTLNSWSIEILTE